jgi:hypothetical protein
VLLMHRLDVQVNCARNAPGTVLEWKLPTARTRNPLVLAVIQRTTRYISQRFSNNLVQ